MADAEVSTRVTRMVSLRSLATQLDVSIHAVRRWTDRRLLQPYRLGRNLYVKAEDVEALIARAALPFDRPRLPIPPQIVAGRDRLAQAAASRRTANGGDGARPRVGRTRPK